MAAGREQAARSFLCFLFFVGGADWVKNGENELGGESSRQGGEAAEKQAQEREEKKKMNFSFS